MYGWAECAWFLVPLRGGKSGGGAVGGGEWDVYLTGRRNACARWGGIRDRTMGDGVMDGLLDC